MIGDVKLITVKHLVIALDGDISALIEQGRERGHPFCRRIKILALGIHGTQGRGEDIELPHHVDEVGGCTGTEPVIGYLPSEKQLSRLYGLKMSGDGHVK